MFVLVLYYGAVWGFGIINKLAHKNNKDLILVGAISFLLSAIFLLRQVLLVIKESSFKKIIKDNYLLVIIILVFIALSFETIFEIPWHDAEYYYCWEIKKISYWFDYTWNDISNYTLAGHFSIGYSLIALLAELIYPQNALFLHLFNIILAIISSVSLYRILSCIYPKMKKNTKSVLVSIYLFSPWILGIIGFINIDVPSIYFFVIWLSCLLYDKKLLQFVFAFLFVFTKEPSIIYFAFACLGILIADFLCKRKSEQKDHLIIFAFKRVGLLLFEVIIGISWLTCFLYRSKNGATWGGDVFNNSEKLHCFGFSWWNIEYKFKGIFLINFNWIIVLIIFFALIKRIFSKAKIISAEQIKSLDKLVYYRCVLVSTFFGFLIFNLAYIDFQHPRYNAIGAVLLILIGIDAINNLFSEKKIIIISCIISILMLTQSMLTIDLVTFFIYDNITDFGTNMLVGVDGRKSLMAVYNREYSYYFKAIEQVLIECDYDGDEDIVLDGVPASFGPMNDFWWDIKAKRMCPTTNSYAFMMNFIWDAEGYNEFDENHMKRIYIYPYTYNFDNEDVIQRGTVRYRTIRLKYEIRESDDTKVFVE